MPVYNDVGNYPKAHYGSTNWDYAPGVSTVIGVVRVVRAVRHGIRMAQLEFNIAGQDSVTSRDKKVGAERKMALYEVTRGITEMIPVLGNIALLIVDRIWVPKGFDDTPSAPFPSGWYKQSNRPTSTEYTFPSCSGILIMADKKYELPKEKHASVEVKADQLKRVTIDGDNQVNVKAIEVGDGEETLRVYYQEIFRECREKDLVSVELPLLGAAELGKEVAKKALMKAIDQEFQRAKPLEKIIIFKSEVE